jgi:hypothetical protein
LCLNFLIAGLILLSEGCTELFFVSFLKVCFRLVVQK